MGEGEVEKGKGEGQRTASGQRGGETDKVHKQMVVYKVEGGNNTLG